MQDSEKKLMDEILQLIRRYPDFESPYSRADGDIVIPLNSALKKNREAHKRFANAFSQMMKNDATKRRKNKAWV